MHLCPSLVYRCYWSSHDCSSYTPLATSLPITVPLACTALLEIRLQRAEGTPFPEVCLLYFWHSVAAYQQAMGAEEPCTQPALTCMQKTLSV